MTAAIDIQRSLSHDDYDHYLPLVRRIAMRLARRLPAHVSVDDLISCGWIGLAEAFSRTHAGMPEEEVEAFASTRVRGAMLDHLRALDPATRQTRSTARDLERAQSSLAHTLGRAPTSSEVADALGVDLDSYHQLVKTAATASPTHLELVDADRLGSSESADAPDEIVAQRLMQARVAEAITQLPERLQHVLALYYQESCTLKEVGAVLGVTESRVCQLHSDAVRRLRGILG